MCINCNTDCNSTCLSNTCACSTYLSTDCITLKEDLVCSNTLKSQTLTEVLKLLDAYICERFESLENFFDLINVGAGSQIYKGISNIGKKQLRTLVNSNLITITQGVDTITIAVNETNLNTFIEANQKTYSATNLGIGSEIYKGITVVGDNTQLNLRKIKSSNSSVSITQGLDDIDITVAAGITSNLEEVLAQGNVALYSAIKLGALSEQNSELSKGYLSFKDPSLGSLFSYQSNGIISYNSAFNFSSIQVPVKPLNNVTFLTPLKNTGTYTLATTADIPASTVPPTLESVLTNGNTSTTSPGETHFELISQLFGGGSLTNITAFKGNEILITSVGSGTKVNSSGINTTLDFYNTSATGFSLSGNGFHLKTNSAGFVGIIKTDSLVQNTIFQFPQYLGVSPVTLTASVNGIFADMYGNIQIPNLQKVLTYPADFVGTNYTLTNADNNFEIIVNNGATVVTITVPAGLTSKIGVGFTQKGTGNVSYVASGTTINNPIGLKIKGQFYQTFLSQELATNNYFLGGNTKI